MSVIAVALKHMLASGMDHEAIVAAVAAMEAEVPPRSAGAVRQERYRRNKASRVTECNSSDALSSPEVSPQTPLPNPINPNTPSPPKGGSVPAGFDEFWSAYPHKVGKADAVKAFGRALKRVVLSDLLDGLSLYAAKTDDRPWCNPATWLNQDRWLDRPAQQPRGSPPPQRAPSQADVFAFIARKSQDDPGQEHEDRRRVRPAIPDLSAG